MWPIFIVYLIGVFYFIIPVEGYSFRENTTYAILWPLVFIVALFGLIVLVLAGKYGEVKSKISK